MAMVRWFGFVDTSQYQRFEFDLASTNALFIGCGRFCSTKYTSEDAR